MPTGVAFSRGLSGDFLYDFYLGLGKGDCDDCSLVGDLSGCFSTRLLDEDLSLVLSGEEDDWQPSVFRL